MTWKFFFFFFLAFRQPPANYFPKILQTHKILLNKKRSSKNFLFMLEWMEWMNEWLNGRMDGWMDERMDGWMDEWLDGWMNEWMDGWMNDTFSKYCKPCQCLNRGVEKLFRVLIPKRRIFRGMDDGGGVGLEGLKNK